MFHDVLFIVSEENKWKRLRLFRNCVNALCPHLYLYLKCLRIWKVSRLFWWEYDGTSWSFWLLSALEWSGTGRNSRGLRHHTAPMTSVVRPRENTKRGLALKGMRKPGNNVHVSIMNTSSMKRSLMFLFFSLPSTSLVYSADYSKYSRYCLLKTHIYSISNTWSWHVHFKLKKYLPVSENKLLSWFNVEYKSVVTDDYLSYNEPKSPYNFFFLF